MNDTEHLTQQPIDMNDSPAISSQMPLAHAQSSNSSIFPKVSVCSTLLTLVD